MSVVGFLPLKLTLTAPAVVPVLADPVRTVTGTTIPGRVLQGLLAAAAGASDHDARQERILDWVVRGEGVQVGPGFGSPPGDDDHPLRRPPVHPAPLSWHTADRYDHRGRPLLVDLLDGDDIPAGATRLTQVRAVVATDETTRPVRVDTAAWWHQQRDRGPGRPNESTGGPFEMVALSAGQVFTTSWRLSAASIGALNDLLDYGLALDLTEAAPRLRIGAAATTRYGGGVILTLLDPVDPLPGAPRLQRRHTPTRPLTPWRQGTARDVLLVSPTLTADGAPRSAAAAAAVQAAWGGPGTVEVVDQWVEHLRYGGYNSTWRGPVTEQWAAAPGSVVRLRALVDVTVEEQVAAENVSIGVRTAEGTGRQLLLDPAHTPGLLGEPIGCTATDGPAIHLLGDPIDEQLTLPDGATTDPVQLPTPGTAGSWADTTVVALQHRLFQQAAAPAVRAAGGTVVGKSISTIPPAHLLSRVAALLDDTESSAQALAVLRSALSAPADAPVFAPKAATALRRWQLARHPATDWLQADAPAGRDGWWQLLHQTPFRTGERLHLPTVLVPLTLACWEDPDEVRAAWIAHHNDDLTAALIRSVLTAARRAVKKDRT